MNPFKKSASCAFGKGIDTTPDMIKTDMIPGMVRETGITPSQLHPYAYSFPVSSLVGGCTIMAELEYNIWLLQNFKDLSNSDMQSLDKHVKPYAGQIVENDKRVLDI